MEKRFIVRDFKTKHLIDYSGYVLDDDEDVYVFDSYAEFDTIEDAERFIEGQEGRFQIEAIYISH
jgi:hypothetical protein